MLPNDFDPSRRDLKADIQRRLQYSQLNGQVLSLIEGAYQAAIEESGIVLSRAEQSHLRRVILKEILEQIIHDLPKSP